MKKQRFGLDVKWERGYVIDGIIKFPVSFSSGYAGYIDIPFSSRNSDAAKRVFKEVFRSGKDRKTSPKASASGPELAQSVLGKR